MTEHAGYILQRIIPFLRQFAQHKLHAGNEYPLVHIGCIGARTNAVFKLRRVLAAIDTDGVILRFFGLGHASPVADAALEFPGAPISVIVFGGVVFDRIRTALRTDPLGFVPGLSVDDRLMMIGKGDFLPLIPHGLMAQIVGHHRFLLDQIARILLIFDDPHDQGGRPGFDPFIEWGVFLRQLPGNGIGPHFFMNIQIEDSPNNFRFFFIDG